MQGASSYSRFSTVFGIRQLLIQEILRIFATTYNTGMDRFIGA